ncbi:MAG: S41 family peptidase [Candidatus Zixiibacteriota bacterium]|nr:MAG: S41 family peptidase [candidate division Zixibacteria bacterium]
MLGEYVKIRKSALFAGVAIIALLIGGLVYALADNLYTSLEEFAQVASVVGSHYMEDVDSEDLIRAGIKGMLETLDPYSEYLDPKRHQALLEHTHGQFEGLGIEITIKDGWLTVISPLEDTPAERMGIQAGDRIIEIEGISTEGIPAEEAVAKLRGKKGTMVNITIEREGIREPMGYTIERDVISLRAVPYFGVAPGGIGYVRLNRFSDISSDELKEAVSDLLQEDIKGLILDLRGNPGGLLTQAVAVASVFLEPDRLVVETKGKAKSQNKQFHSFGKPLYPDLPLAVLVDGGSASGSEIVAGAIQDWDRGVIIGDTTFGKGLVQNVIQLKDGAGLKLSTAKYLIPSGRSIQRLEELSGTISSLETDIDEETGAPDSSRAKHRFFTKGGRVVYGGGGITPDLIVPHERLSPLEYNLLAKLSFFDFAVHYTATHPDMPKGLEVDDAMLSEFKQFLESKDFTYQTSSEVELEELKEAVKEEEATEKITGPIQDLEELLRAEKEKNFERSREYISSEIKENILVKLYGQSAKYEGVWFEHHPQIRRAIQLLSNPGEYKRLLTSG